MAAMAADVSLSAMFVIFVLSVVCLVCGDEEEIRLVTRPLYLEDNLYFELVEPVEISYTYKIRPAKDFGMPLNRTYFSIHLVPTEPSDGCSPITNSIYMKDNIAFVERGGCSFLTKALHCEKVGAIAVIVGDNNYENDQRMIDMIQDETGRKTDIPAYFLLGRDSYMIRQTLERLRIVSALINIPINATGIPTYQLKQPPWTLW